MREWEPIETAPRDGTAILLWGPPQGGDEATLAVAEYHVESDGFAGWETGHTDNKRIYLHHRVSHWMPLPAPPK